MNFRQNENGSLSKKKKKTRNKYHFDAMLNKVDMSQNGKSIGKFYHKSKVDIHVQLQSRSTKSHSRSYSTEKASKGN